MAQPGTPSQPLFPGRESCPAHPRHHTGPVGLPQARDNEPGITWDNTHMGVQTEPPDVFATSTRDKTHVYLKQEGGGCL